MSNSIWDDPKLAEVVAEARNVTEQLQIMYSSEESPGLETARRESITEQSSPTPLTRERTTTWRLPLALVATAAALLLLVGSPILREQTIDTTVSTEVANPVMPEPDDSARSFTQESAKLEIETDGQAGMQDERLREAAVGKSVEEAAKPAGTLSEDVMDFQMAHAEGDSQQMGLGIGASAPGKALDKRLAGEAKNKSLEQSKRMPPAMPAAGRQAEIPPPASPNIKLKSASTPDVALRRRATNNDDDAAFRIPTTPDTNNGLADRDRFKNITENSYKRVSDAPLSTFSVDVDTASYSKTREYLLRQRRLPPVDAVRIEELVNYFDYEYLPPKDDAEVPFAVTAEIISCPWNNKHRLARIALKGKEMKTQERPLSNLVFLLDTSGSMNARNKLPLVRQGMKMLLSQLGENDRVAIVVYAGSAGLVLDSTPATKTRKIENALNALAAGGSTNGGQGIELAYQIARDNFIVGGVNRVILCTDGDFNVGTTGTGALVRMVEKEAAGNIFLSVLGFGMGNHNDNMLEQISGRGNGNYAFIDTEKEAQKVLVDQVNGTLVTIAKDVKLQIEFNPRMVAAYRLIGYENRVLAKEDFNDDKKDAGEIGAGHAVTALYELIPVGSEDNAVPPQVDNLKYQSPQELTDAANRDESLTLKLRYKEPDGDTSKLVEFPVVDNETTFQDADHDARFAAAVASFGMQLRESKYSGDWSFQDVIDVAKDAKGEDMSGLRAEFVEIVEAASKMK